MSEVEKPTAKRRITETMPLVQAARRLQCSYQTAYDYFLRGRLKGWKRGSRILVTKRSVEVIRAERGIED